MVRRCKRAGGYWCHTYAMIYYGATRLFGYSFYAEYSFEVCKHSKCVDKALRHFIHNKGDNENEKNDDVQDT